MQLMWNTHKILESYSKYWVHIYTFVKKEKKIANKNGTFRFMRYGNKVRAQELLLFEKSL